MLSYAEVFYEGARSCYPRALFSQIKVPPFKEKKGRKKRQRSRSQNWHMIQKLTAFRKGQEQKSQNNLRIECRLEETLDTNQLPRNTPASW